MFSYLPGPGAYGGRGHLRGSAPWSVAVLLAAAGPADRCAGRRRRRRDVPGGCGHGDRQRPGAADRRLGDPAAGLRRARRTAQNMYAMTWTGSPGIQDAFTYLPWTAVLLAPGRWLAGDVRWALLAWTLVAVAGLLLLGRGGRPATGRRPGRPAPVVALLLLAPGHAHPGRPGVDRAAAARRARRGGPCWCARTAPGGPSSRSRSPARASSTSRCCCRSCSCGARSAGAAPSPPAR